MQTDASLAANSRLRLRGDLNTLQQPVGFSSRWIVKDPWTLSHFEFTEDEWFLLQQLDGQSTLQDIQARYQQRFAPQEISLQRMRQFFATGYKAGLVLTDGAGLSERRHRTTRQRILRAPLGVLNLRFTAGDAQPWLDRLRPLGNLLFHPLFAGCWLVALVAGLLLAVGRVPQIVAQLPTWSTFFSGSNLWLLGLSWLLVKLVHELAHGLACRKFGGECHEFGVQLVVCFPLAYCDVSDAWMIPSKWQRMLVSAAGIYVELLLATLGMYLWAFSEPGLGHSLLFNLIILCSVNTLLFNANPLLKFDGYYILSDWLEIPNLQTQAQAALWWPLQNWLVPHSTTQPRLDGNRWGLALFGVLAFCYRLFVMGVIAWTIYQFLAPAHLTPLADMVVLLMLLSLLAPAVVWSSRITLHPLLRTMVRQGRLVGLVLAGVLVVGAILFWPWQRRLEAPLFLRLQDAAYVYATVPGQLVSHLEPGQAVGQGGVVAKLANLELERRALEFRSRYEELTQELATFEVQVIQSPQRAADLAATQAAIRQAQQQWLAAQEDQRDLTITAPRAGAFLPARYRPPASTAAALPLWDGTPLESRNAHCYVEPGDLLGVVGDPTALQAVLLVSQDDIERITPGAPVSIRLEHTPGRCWQGQVTQVSRNAISKIPAAFLSGDAIAVDQGDRPAATHYFVEVDFVQPPAGALPESRGQAKVVVSTSTLGREWLRRLQQIFYFEFLR